MLKIHLPNHTLNIDDLVIYGTHHRVIAIDGEWVTLEPFDYGILKTTKQALHDSERAAIKERQNEETNAMFARHREELGLIGDAYLNELGEWVQKMENAVRIEAGELKAET